MGIPSPKVLVSKAKELLFGALALTDSSNVCGVVEAVEAAEKEGIKLIIGAEIWTIDGPESEKEPAPGAQLAPCAGVCTAAGLAAELDSSSQPASLAVTPPALAV